MPTQETTPVEDTVPKINDELAVGSDLEFQHRWQKLERIIWIVLIAFLLLSAAGVFGRGPLANATAQASDGSMNLKYERVERFSTPSVMTVNLEPSSIQDQAVRLWVSDSLVKPLGNQRVVPQPEKSELVDGGILYTFSAAKGPTSVEFQMQPSALGSSKLTLQVPGKPALSVNIFVVP